MVYQLLRKSAFQSQRLLHHGPFSERYAVKSKFGPRHASLVHTVLYQKVADPAPRLQQRYNAVQRIRTDYRDTAA